jgi:iron(II)-dependent oxidoreductase
MFRTLVGLPLAGLMIGALAAAAAADEAEIIPGNPLVAVAGGAFVFGNDSGPENERPQSMATVAGFAMNRTEITNAQYRRFVDETGYRSAFYGGHPQLGVDNRPVVGVNWEDAAAFCAHYGLMLPTEPQFERAARGKDGAAFPWGAEPPGMSRANAGADGCCVADARDGYAMTAPVDSFNEVANAEGLLHLVGNVWEWTREPYAPYTGEADEATAGQYRVLRGGAWNSDPAHLTTTYRLAYDPTFRFAANGGFRCVSEQE